VKPLRRGEDEDLIVTLTGKRSSVPWAFAFANDEA
jgi:hypothetical protein